MKSHPIPGLPDVWEVQERATSSGTRYFPKLNGRHLMRPNGIAWFQSRTEAEKAATDLVARMQE